ncbi:hypothetical protein Y032_0098g3052 [Ancylostoma ceylanicum]|uniref:Uncharacterized protein n=1 Tax=Ancylostoma ceylanicum TaxID=53326 RepID=A0A016TI81_9BILA|nr:hypothetical protein Y032_0098g3052 [Ancylostoma ceylanicum]
MGRLLILFATFAILGPVQACAPPLSTLPPIEPRKRKRDVEEVQVTAVTNQKYNPSLNDDHLQTMRALLNDYCISKNIVYDRDLVQEAVANVGGKFAVVYTMLDADCDGVHHIAQGAKRRAMFITRIEIKCGSKPEIVIN